MIKFETINGTFCRMVEPEPKPLLADAKVGDLCKTDLDEWIQIDDTFESLNPILYHFDRPFKGNLIHAEPLAPEGSAAWAWQMVMLGKTVYNPSYYYSSSHGLITPNMLGNCSKQSFVDWQEPSGWQIYKEPELKYKVGDWVEVESSHTKGKTFVSVIKEMPNQKHYTVHVNSYFGGYTVYGVMERQIVRKLKPSEVRIRIGCLSGTVRPVSTNGIHIWFHLIGVDDKTIATIRISCLDAPTRELVESLLEAMREEKK
jgi:hypothetical protein